ncbi:MAG: LysE family transporter [Bacteroidetes bacterium]|nr:LysE family transporter [Bacteroidota bacterium]
MLEPILSGIIFGLLLAIMLGPVFFTLLQTSLHEGFKAGVFLALGVLMSDAFCIMVAYLFASQLDLSGKYKVVMGWTGGLLLISFGVINFFRKVKPKEVDDDKKTVHAKFMLKGFVMNTLNPAVILFWVGVISLVKLKEGYTKLEDAEFFVSVLGTVFSIDLLKAFIANRISHLLNASVLHWINWIVGIVLVVFGAGMIIKVV